MSDDNKKLTLEMILNMQSVVETLEELVTKGGDADDRMIALQDTIKKMADIAGVSFEEAGKSVLKLSASLEKIDVSVGQVAAAVDNLSKGSSEFEGIKTDASVSEIAELSSSLDNLNSEIRETGEVVRESFIKVASDVEGGGLDDKIRDIGKSIAETEEESSKFEGIKTDDSVAETKKFTEAVDALKETLKSTASEAETGFSDAAEGIRNSDVEGSVKEISTELRKVEVEAEKLESVSTVFREIGESLAEMGEEEIDFNVDSAIAATHKLREVTDEYKETVGDAAVETSENFKFVGDGIKNADIPKSVRGITNAVSELEVESGKLSARPGGLINAEPSIASVEKSRVSIDKLKDAIYSVARATGESFKFASDGVKNSHLDVNIKDVDKAVRELQADLGKGVSTDGLSTLSAEMNRAKNSAGGLRTAFDKMGTTIQTVFGFTVANIVTRTLHAFTKFAKDAVASAEELTRSLFRMSVGIRALQTTGMSVEIGEFADKIKELRDEWGTFTTRELVGAVGYMTLLTREIGLTKDQMFKLMDASAALSVLLGKDMNETLRQVSLAISSGYAEALQRAGLNVNKVEIAHKALEMGINKTFMAMTGEERALVTLTLILEQTANVTEDAAKWQETLGGQIEKNEKTIDQFSDTMGVKFLPVWAAFVDLVAKASEGFLIVTDFKLFAQSLGRFITKPVGKAIVAAQMMWKNLSGKGDYTLDDFKEAAEEVEKFIDESLRDAMDERIDLLNFPLDDVGALMAKSLKKGFIGEMANFLDDPIVFEAFDELKDIIADVNDDIADEMEDFHRSQLINQRRFSFKLEQLLIANAAARAKLIRKTNDKIEGENIKYQQNLADAHADYLQDQSDAELDYRRRELDSEQDYQDELRKMRDQLLFDLEEAVRQRDASQIRRLLRQAEFRKSQLGVDHERESEENKERLERELADNRLKLKRELEDIRRAHAIRLREIRIDGKRQLAELARTQQARMQALMEQERLERELAAEKHARELADIRAGGEEKVRLWAENFLAMYGITVDATDEIYRYLNGAFGPGGSIEGLFQYLTDMVTQMVLQFQKLAGSMKSMPKGGWDKAGTNPLKPPVDATSWAEGGTLIANKPTLAVFGDNGPERVDFTPIGRRGSDVGKVFGGALPSGSDAQKLALEILLSPDLEARITENTLGEFSDILVSVERTV